jgi:hypothetical protein
MTSWTPDELTMVGNAIELLITSRRPDGSLRPETTIWHVRCGDEIYVRSAHGVANGWYRRALESGSGRIRAAGVERDVTFTPAAPSTRDSVTAAYHAKYDRYGPAPVGAVTGPDVLDTTLRLAPQH